AARRRGHEHPVIAACLGKRNRRSRPAAEAVCLEPFELGGALEIVENVGTDRDDAADFMIRTDHGFLGCATGTSWLSWMPSAAPTWCGACSAKRSRSRSWRSAWRCIWRSAADSIAWWAGLPKHRQECLCHTNPPNVAQTTAVQIRFRKRRFT